MDGQSGVLIGLRDGRIAATPFHVVAGAKKPLDPALFELLRTMAK
jgi:hypothetical protein